LLTELRTQDHDSKGKQGRKVHIACIFKCHNRSPTPPSKLDNKKEKSHQNRGRSVQFSQEKEDKDNEDEAESESGSKSDEELVLKPGRLSATKNQLDCKRRRDAKATAQELTRQKIFINNQCKEPNYENKRACCYLINKGKVYYLIDLKDQNT
jgi:hypothetical protein